MTSDPLFTAAALALAESFGWPARAFAEGEEQVVAAALPADSPWEQVIWVASPQSGLLRGLLIWRGAVPAARRAAVLELCARVNDGLPSGCLEYGFADDSLAFRESADLGEGAVTPVEALTSRLLHLGKRYGPALAGVLGGGEPVAAVAAAESD